MSRLPYVFLGLLFGVCALVSVVLGVHGVSVCLLPPVAAYLAAMFICGGAFIVRHFCIDRLYCVSSRFKDVLRTVNAYAVLLSLAAVPLTVAEYTLGEAYRLLKYVPAHVPEVITGNAVTILVSTALALTIASYVPTRIARSRTEGGAIN